ncbi:hypothetical protein FRB99_000554 [Tulasnella sp. 403]|nr:hypothetical protein FRB99_000554 [Tulasnella sp. 403]
MSPPSQTLIQNGTIVTCVKDDKLPIHYPADVLIRDSLIVQISDPNTIVAEEGTLVIDATDKLICPGFIDTHRHVWEAPFKWMGDWTLMEYVGKCIRLLTPVLEPKDAYASQLHGVLEALNAGVTTMVDFCHLTTTPEMFPAMLEATKESGIRSFICYSRWEEWPYGKGRKVWQMEQIKKYAKEGTGSDRVTFSLAFEGFDDTFFAELKDELWPIASEHGIDVLGTHYVSGMNNLSGRTVEEFHSRGLLDRPVLFVHASGADEKDFERIVASGSGISAAPETELHMSHGDPNAMFADDAGVRVGLSVDCSTVVSGDMFAVMRSCLSWHRGVENAKLSRDGKLPMHNKRRAGDAFRLATIGGAKAIHRESMIGSIEVGKKADILLIETLSPGMLGCQRDPVQGVVLHATPEDVSMVIVDGEVVVDKSRAKADGVFTRVDWSTAVSDVRGALERVRAKIDDTKEEKSYMELADMLGLHAKSTDDY